MEQNKLYFTDGDYILGLQKDECIPLELKLNITKYGVDWKHIGDVLYYFGAYKQVNKLSITPKQLNYLIKINKMSYDDVNKMVKYEIKNPE